MSLSQETMLELIALADGELEGADRARVEKLLAESEDARRVVESLRSPHLGTWLNEIVGQSAAAADGIADTVMARIERGQLDEGPAVVRLADMRRARSLADRGWSSRRWVLLWPSRPGSPLVMRPGKSGDGSARVANANPSSLQTAPTALAPSAFAVQGARPSQGVEVDEIDSPASSISVFEIPVESAKAAAKPSSVVIWIEDDQGAK